MENQINLGDQNTQQIGQNTYNQQGLTPEKPKTNYLLIGGIILVCFVLFGFGGYYLGKQYSKSTADLNQSQATPLPSEDENDKTSKSKTYKNTQYGVLFNYPQNYTISTKSDCSELIGNQSECLISMDINATNSDYPSKADFWLLRGINSVRISGQVSSINFDSQKKAWVINEGVSHAEIMPAWDRTKLGQEIIRASNGGSHGSSNYFLIPDYQNDRVAIFAIPQSFRLRCDNFSDDKIKEADCNNFYKSVIDKYNQGETTVDTWLPDNYFGSIYSEAETMIKSYEETTSVSNSNVTKAIDILTEIPEVQIIEKSIIKAGRKPFYTPEGENGDIITISLRESFPDDPHTSRIDTFNVNTKSKVITVEDVFSGNNISLEEWKKTVKERFQ